MVDALPTAVQNRYNKLIKVGIPYKIAIELAWTVRQDSVGSVEGAVLFGPGRNPLTGMFHADAYGAIPDGRDCWDPIQTALDDADAWNRAGNAPAGGARGGSVFLPAAAGFYSISKALVMDARVALIGQRGGTWGGKGTRIQARAGGDFTNGANTDKWMLKLTRNAKNSGTWFHAGSVEQIFLDANNQPGLGCMWGSHAGENSRIDRVQLGGTGITTRTATNVTFNGTDIVTAADMGADVLEDMFAQVSSASFPTYTDAAFTGLSTVAGSTTLTGTGFTTALVGSELTASNSSFQLGSRVVSVAGDGLTLVLSRPAGSTQTGKTGTFGRPRNFRIIEIISATSVRLNQPVNFTGTGSMTIDRPRPGARFNGWTATGYIGSINVSNCSGAGVEFVGSGSNLIGSIAGDNNGGALIRFHACSTAADPQTTVLQSFKAENNNYGDTSAQQYENYADHECAILIDKCGMMNLEIEGGVAYASERGSKDVVRILGSTGTWQIGYPSVTVKGLEAGNPYNNEFENIIRDLDTGKKVAAGNILSPVGGRFYPTISWYKDQQIVQGDLKVDGGKVLIDGVAVNAGVEPWKWDWMWQQPVPYTKDLSGNGWHQIGVDAGQSTGYYGVAYPFGTSTALAGAEFHWFPVLSAGTYTIQLSVKRDPTYGQAKLQYTTDLTGATGWTDITRTHDGTSWPVNNTTDSVFWNFYNATTQANYRMQAQGFVLPKSGPIRLRLINVAAGDGAGTGTGFVFVVSSINFTRTS
jgi:hypothetical protein